MPYLLSRQIITNLFTGTLVCDLNGYKLFSDERSGIECMWGLVFLLPLKHTETHGRGNMDISAITLHILILEKKQ